MTPWRSPSAPSRCAATRPARRVGPTPARSSSPSTTNSACRTLTEHAPPSGTRTRWRRSGVAGGNPLDRCHDTDGLGKTVQVNGVELAWSEQGTSPAGTPSLVLVHGFTGSSHDFALEVDALARAGAVVTLDQRGHGHSTKTGALDGYTHRPAGRRPASRSSRRSGAARSICSATPWGAGRPGRRPQPARPGELARAHGHERLVLHAARRGHPCHGQHVHHGVRPGAGHAGHAQPRRPRGRR